LFVRPSGSSGTAGERARNLPADDPQLSVVNADCRSWDIPNLWICDGAVFPTIGGVNPSLTIQAIACRTADRIKEMAARGEL
jgi:choline dehydrogenase-like flavoprotein